VAYENGDPDGKVEKLRRDYERQQQGSLSKFFASISPIPRAHALFALFLAPEMVYFFVGLGIIGYTKLKQSEQSDFDYAMSESEGVNLDLPKVNYHTFPLELGMWLKDKFTTQPDLPNGTTGFPIHESDNDPYITPIPDAEAHGKQIEHIPIIDNLGQILSQPVQDDILGSNSYINPIPREDLLWKFVAYEPNADIEQGSSKFNKNDAGSTKTIKYKLPGEGKEWVKLKNRPGWQNTETKHIWKKDMLHKDHWDVLDKSEKNKIMEVDFNGNKIWPNGPKNKNKKTIK
jgi:hypothetical protein